MGPAHESGGTALTLKSPAPGVRWLYGMGLIRRGMKILDYGAGFGRNAQWLRSLGIEVYAYDPFNADDRKARIFANMYSDSVADFRVSDKMPEGPFDLSFTSYVLCVVPKHEQDRIVQHLQEITTGTQYHIIVPPRALQKRVKAMLQNQRQPAWDFYGAYQNENKGNWSLPEFCTYGVKTTKGFQRAVHRTKTLRHAHSNPGWQILAVDPPTNNGE